MIKYLTITLLFSYNCMAEENKTLDIGRILYSQNKYSQSREILEPLIQESSAASYIYAKTYADNIFIQNKNEHKYLLNSARIGNINAIVDLSLSRSLGDREKWKKLALIILEERAKKDDTYAMYLLSIIDNRIKWLKRASSLGDGRAQYNLYESYKNGDGFFIFDSSRRNATQALLTLSFENKFNKAIIQKSREKSHQGNLNMSLSIIKPLLDKGDASAIIAIANMHNFTHNENKTNRLLIASQYYAIHSHFIKNEQYEEGISLSKKMSDRINKSLSIEDLAIVKERINNYINDHVVYYEHNKDYGYSLTNDEMIFFRKRLISIDSPL